MSCNTVAGATMARYPSILLAGEMAFHLFHSRTGEGIALQE